MLDRRFFYGRAAAKSFPQMNEAANVRRPQQSTRWSTRSVRLASKPLVPRHKFKSEATIVHMEETICSLDHRVRLNLLYFLRHHANVLLIATLVAEAIEAQSVRKSIQWTISCFNRMSDALTGELSQPLGISPTMSYAISFTSHTMSEMPLLGPEGVNVTGRLPLFPVLPPPQN